MDKEITDLILKIEECLNFDKAITAYNFIVEYTLKVREDTLRQVLPNDPTYFQYEDGGRGYEAAVDHIRNKAKLIWDIDLTNLN